MPSPDFTQVVIDAVSNNIVGYGMSGYGTFGYGHDSLDDIPLVLFDRDERRRDDTDEYVKNLDVTDTNIVSVDSSPPRSNTPMGTNFDLKVRAGVGVRVEAAHQDAGGHMASKNEFDTLTDNVTTAIWRERKFPTSGANYGYKDLMIEEEDDLSASENRREWFHYRYDFTVWFMGFEELP